MAKKALQVSHQTPASIQLWAQVIVTPELRRTTVLSRGTEKGLIGWIPTGGQTAPISIEGLRAEWK